MDSNHSSLLSPHLLTHQHYTVSEINIQNILSRLVDTISAMDLENFLEQVFQTRQREFQLALHDLAGTVMRTVLENGTFMTPGINFSTQFVTNDGRLQIVWRFSFLPNAFFETLQRDFAEVLSTDAPEFPGQDLFQSILLSFRDLFDQVVQHGEFQMGGLPHRLVYEDSSPVLGQQYRVLEFGVVPPPSLPYPESESD
jgi:hypothetical protein